MLRYTRPNVHHYNAKSLRKQAKPVIDILRTWALFMAFSFTPSSGSPVRQPKPEVQPQPAEPHYGLCKKRASKNMLRHAKMYLKITPGCAQAMLERHWPSR